MYNIKIVGVLNVCNSFLYLHPNSECNFEKAFKREVCHNLTASIWKLDLLKGTSLYVSITHYYFSLSLSSASLLIANNIKLKYFL